MQASDDLFNTFTRGMEDIFYNSSTNCDDSC